MYTVTIGVCTGGTMKSATVTSLVGAMDVIRANGVTAFLAIQIGGYVAVNRNELVETARRNNSTHLMFIDNDQTFKPSAIQRLIDADKDIICAPYNARPAPGKQLVSVIKLMDKKGRLRMDGGTEGFEMPAGLFKVGGSGTGFMLIKMSVFDKLEKPYFVEWQDKNNNHHTEDIDFCVKARKAGFDVWCNPTIPVGHIAEIEV